MMGSDDEMEFWASSVVFQLFLSEGLETLGQKVQKI